MLLIGWFFDFASYIMIQFYFFMIIHFNLFNQLSNNNKYHLHVQNCLCNWRMWKVVTLTKKQDVRVEYTCFSTNTRDQQAANFSRKDDLFVGILPCLSRRRTHGLHMVATIFCHVCFEEDSPVQVISIIQRMLFSRSVLGQSHTF